MNVMRIKVRTFLHFLKERRKQAQEHSHVKNKERQVCYFCDWDLSEILFNTDGEVSSVHSLFLR